jgi:hypothetical protein
MPDRTSDAPRLRALGDELVRIHDGLRAEIAALLADIEAGHGGHGGHGGHAVRPAPDVRARLHERCLSVCEAVRAHHANETDRGFPLLAERSPGLTPVLDRLRGEHQVLADMLDRFYETFGKLGGTGDLGDAGDAWDVHDVHAELRRLAAEMEAHFDREERQLVAALNAL